MQAQLGGAKKQASRLASTASLTRCTCQASTQPSRRASTSAVTLDDPSFFFYPSYTAAKSPSPRSHSPSRSPNRTRSRYSLLRRHDSRPLISSRYQVVYATPPLLSAGVARSQSTTSSEHVPDNYKLPAIMSSPAFYKGSDSVRRHSEQQEDGKGKGKEVDHDVAKSEAEAKARLHLESRIAEMGDEKGTFQKLLKRSKLEEARSHYEAVASDLHALLREFPPFEQEAKKLTIALRNILPKLLHPYVAYSDSASISDLLSFFERDFDFPQVPWRQLPTSGSYNMLLQTYVQQLDVAKAFRTVRRMKRNGHKPTVQTFTSLITLYSHKRNPESARDVFEHMLSEGIQPSQHSYTALMNAYTEAGQWNEAVDLFKYLDEHPPEHPLKPDIHTWTTLLKAYVLMGAPIDQVLSVYREILERRLKPQARTFTLALQAACDAGLVELAEEIFAKMDSMSKKYPEPLANVYSFSVMMRGLLRAGKQDAAREYYEEMLKRGIEATSATWSIMITAYAQGNDSDSSRLVQELLDEYMNSYITDIDSPEKKKLHSLDPNVARGTALQSVYGPVITAYAQMANIKAEAPSAPPERDEGDEPAEEDHANSGKDKALRTLQQMLRHPRAKPSIPIYTALLDAYRRVDDIEGMLEIWKQLVELALNSTSRDYARSLQDAAADQLESEHVQPSIDPSRRNMLCLPLSILINGLSANHKHATVAAVWAEVQHRGFGFDASNFNHLAVAFVRAGELQRAFWTVEALLLQPELEKDETSPINREDLNMIEEDQSRSQSGNSDIQATVGNDVDLSAQLLASRVDTPIRPPNRAHEMQPDLKRQFRREHMRLRLPEMTMDHLADPSENQESGDDALSTLPVPDPDAPEQFVRERATGNADTLDKEDAYDLASLHKGQSARASDLIADKENASVPVLQESITESFEHMAKARKKALWKAHAATLTELEMAILRLERRAGDREIDRAGERHISAEEAADLAAQIRHQFPLTIQAIERHRARLDMVRGRLLRA